MNWGWHRPKEPVLNTNKATQAESRLAAIKKVTTEGRLLQQQRDPTKCKHR